MCVCVHVYMCVNVGVNRECMRARGGGGEELLLRPLMLLTNCFSCFLANSGVLALVDELLACVDSAAPSLGPSCSSVPGRETSPDDSCE